MVRARERVKKMNVRLSKYPKSDLSKPVYACVSMFAMRLVQSDLVMEFQHVLNVVSIKQVVDQLSHYYPYKVNTLTLKPVSIM